MTVSASDPSSLSLGIVAAGFAMSLAVPIFIIRQFPLPAGASSSKPDPTESKRLAVLRLWTFLGLNVLGAIVAFYSDKAVGAAMPSGSMSFWVGFALFSLATLTIAILRRKSKIEDRQRKSKKFRQELAGQHAERDARQTAFKAEVGAALNGFLHTVTVEQEDYGYQFTPVYDKMAMGLSGDALNLRLLGFSVLNGEVTKAYDRTIPLKSMRSVDRSDRLVIYDVDPVGSYSELAFGVDDVSDPLVRFNIPDGEIAEIWVHRILAAISKAKSS